MVHYVFNYYAFSDHYILGNILGIGDTRKNKQNPCSYGTYNSNGGKNKQIDKKYIICWMMIDIIEKKKKP